MKKHRNRIIIAVIIAAVLALIFYWGGNSPGLRGWSSKTNVSQSYITSPAPSEYPSDTSESVSYTSDASANDISNENRVKLTTASPLPTSSKTDVVSNNAEESPNIAVSAPTETPTPREPQDAAISENELTCTLSVRCDIILKNLAWLDAEKVEFVPDDGVIFAEQTVTFYEGESVFELLLREMKKNGIHLEFENTPMYNSAYIEGINNLYEFDCGELSGWMYRVNGWFPNYGCSRYQLKDGDRVEWIYTANGGSDIGGGNYYATSN